MKNKIEDLRNHLFEQLERLSDDDNMKNSETLERELKRAGAISQVASVIVESAKAETLYLKATGARPAGDFIPVSNQKQLN